MPAVPIIAAVSGASAAIGTAAAAAVGLGTVSTLAATAIGTGIVAGGMTAIQGGDVSDVLESAVIGGVTSYVGGTVASAVGSTVAQATGSQIAGAAAGNAAATLVTGGDSEDILASGLLGGIGAGVNQARLAAADEYLSGLPGGHGAYTDDLPDMSDFDLPPAVIDTSFTPDYSLSTGAPVVPGMGAQGIQVPRIDELVDVVNQPVDYSLPIPSGSGLGLQMPTVPTNLGDPNSFINQPTPNVDVVIGDVTETPMTQKELDQRLALADVVQAIAQPAVSALLANDNIIPEKQTGFGIVPIPGDWRSPEYNMAFTPSAPIDFGSPEMLAGTQWAAQPNVAMAQQPMDISTLINNLNLQQTKQPPQFGLDQVVGNINDVPMSINDIISNLGQNAMQPFDMNQNFGELNNAPASLNSIIAGIQSQYG
jgi:hypothetical protein